MLEADGPHSSMRWQVRQPCGCSAMSNSMMPRRRSVSPSDLVVTRMPGDTGVVQDAGLPGRGRYSPSRPGASAVTTHMRHAP